MTLNPNWGGVTEPNTFGTHEFMDFLGQIGAEAFLSVNVGSGTPQEAADWLEYLTTAQPTTLAKERAANGHAAPYKIAYLGIGNESWDCGGNMTPEYYLSQLKIYSRFARNFNPAQQPDAQKMRKVAVGPGGGGPRWTEWTDTIMKAWQARQWSWDMDGLSLHHYTVVRWPPAMASVEFGETEYAQILNSTLEMNHLIATHCGDHGQVRSREEDCAGRRRMGRVVCRVARQHAGLPGPAEQPARRDPRRAQPQHLLAACRARSRRQHRADDQRAAGDDHHRQGEDDADADLPRVPDVRALPGRHRGSGHVRCRLLHASRPHAAARGRDRGEGRRRHALDGADQHRPGAADRNQRARVGHGRPDGNRRSPHRRRGGQCEHFDAPRTVTPQAVSARVQGDQINVALPPKSVTVLSVR